MDEKTGERHIADVKTPKGLVIEFQHSPIQSEELRSRETFYDNMIWIVDGERHTVDGNRGMLDGSYFSMSLSMDPIQLDPLAYQIDLSLWRPGSLLFRWAEATTPVFFDFGRQLNWPFMGTLWRLGEFRPDEGFAVVCPIPLYWVIEACVNGEPIPSAVVDQKDVREFRRGWVEYRPFENL